MYSLSITTGPTEEPITLARAKSHLRIDHDAEDDLITGWIKSARELCEVHCSKRWIDQTATMLLSCWPECGTIELPVEPVSEIVSVKYYDLAGVQQTVSPANYQPWLDHSPPLIAQAPSIFYWPLVQYRRVAPIEVVFKVGFADAESVPEAVKTAMLLCLADWDLNRAGEKTSDRGLPSSALALLSSVSSGAYA